MGKLAPSPKEFTIEERLDIQQAVATWIRIKHEEGQGVTEADASHSSLLHWLLAGNQPLPKPPPVIHSRPCHQLALGEPCHLHEAPSDFEDKVLIAGNLSWKWVSKEDGTLEHLPTGDIYQWGGETNTLQKVV